MEVESTPERRALVQGASRGIGLALVETLLAGGEYTQVIATARHPEKSTGLQELAQAHGPRVSLVPLDVCSEASIAQAAASVGGEGGSRLHLLVNAAGLLHEGRSLRPEKRIEALDADQLQTLFSVNAIGPALVVKHFLPLLKHDQRAVVANISARVGSIEDNRLGGWYGYRASKAAQNMFTRTISLELQRRAPNVICLALHPGTVDTDLSRPFQRGVPAEKLFDARRAARQLLEVADKAQPTDSGSFLAWDGTPIAW